MFLLNMPALFYWAFLLFSTFFVVVSKICDWDLWWHLASGRYIFENGFYPAPDVFSFTSVKAFSVNSYTWLGDLFLFLIYKYAGGETGLYLFKTFAILFPVIILSVISKRKYNIWLLFFSYLIIVGSLQNHFLKNSIFAMVFIPSILFCWWLAKQKELLWTTILFVPPILGVWTFMHGYVQVGFVFVLLLFIGEMIDRFFDKEKKVLLVSIFFLLSLILSYQIVQINYPIGFKQIIGNFKASINNSEMNASSVETKIGKIDSIEKHEENNKKTKFKNLFRILFKGGDSEIVQEFGSPFDFTMVIFVKILFLFSLIFFVCVLFILYKLRRIEMAFLIPSVLFLYVGLGYLRTTPFVFLISAPLLYEYGVRIGLFSKIFKIPPFIPFILLFSFAVTHLYFAVSGNFQGFTGVYSIHPGLGVANLHSSIVPRYALDNYPEENLFNGYTAGGALIWEWYGKKRVFIDSRSIDYDRVFFDDYVDNLGLKYIHSLDLKRGIFHIEIDRKWYAPYMDDNWNVEVFDATMLLINRRVSENGAEFFNKIPKFIGTLENVQDLQVEQKKDLGFFIHDFMRCMMYFGRFKDAMSFYEDNKELMKCISDNGITIIDETYMLAKSISDYVGIKNDTSLSEIFRDRNENFDQTSLNYAIAEYLIKNNEVKKAVDILVKLSNKNPDNLSLQEKIANKTFELKALLPSINAYERVIALDPGRVHEYNRLGYLYYTLNNFEKAELYFRIAVKNGPDNPESFINLGTILKNNGKREEAKDIINHGIKKHPGNDILKSILNDL